jgi:hypothetical protein
VTPKVLAAALHLDQHDRLPHQIGEGGAAVVGFLDAFFADRPRFSESPVLKRPEEMVEKNLRLTLFRRP